MSARYDYPFEAADPEDRYDGDRHSQRGTSGEMLTLTDMTVGPREAICHQCWLVHRPGQECP